MELFLTVFLVSDFSNQFCMQTYNALFIIRCFTKYLVETYNEEEIIEQFEAKPTLQAGLYFVDSTLMSKSPFKSLNNPNFILGAVDNEANYSYLDSFLDALIEIVVDVPLK